MADRPNTRPKNKLQHPGTNHTRYDTRRRNPTQIAADNIAEAKTRLQALHAAADKRRKRVNEMAQYEAELQNRMEQRKDNATRPDLVPAASTSSRGSRKLTIKIKNVSHGGYIRHKLTYTLKAVYQDIN